VKSLACTGKRALPPFGIHMTMNTDAAPRTPLPTRRRLAAIRCAAFTPTLLLSCAPIVHADAVTDWNAIMETTVLTTDPAARIRTAAIVQVAVFEAGTTNRIATGSKAHRAHRRMLRLSPLRTQCS
jgi:hypothetical protein